MASFDTSPEEAITKDEMQGEDVTVQKPPENAFTKLMAPKPPSSQHKPSRRSSSKMTGTTFPGRMGLGAYTVDPSSFPSSTVIYHDEDFVVIHDKFPKATVHTLLLPRDPSLNLLHPFEAFQDAEFRGKVQAEVGRLKKLVAQELQRKLGSFSAAETKRQAVLDGDEDVILGHGDGVLRDEARGQEGGLPPGRDWESEIIAGVHSVPSMSHLHIHVLSRDMHSPAMKHRKHYNSFQTPFVVGLDEFPLAADDKRWDTREERYLEWDLKCWRCGKNFGNGFAKLKAHLEEEFERWKRL